METGKPDAKPSEASWFILPFSLAGVLAAAWVALTVESGLTYHLAPGLIAAVPGYVLAWSAGQPPSRPVVTVVGLAGLAFVAAGWVGLELADSLPAATFVEDQPGGVRGEMAAFAVLGALLGVRAMLRARRDQNGA